MDDLSVASLQQFMTSSKLRMSEQFCDISLPFEIKSNDFLQYAESDVNTPYEHHLINALTNIKRAIDCQLDSLLFAFGLYKKSKDENWHFPHKLSILKKLGIASPRILNKINTKRNQLEHQYKAPNKEEVEDALDVATLFNAYTDKFLNNALIEVEVHNDNNQQKIEIKGAKEGGADFDMMISDFIVFKIDYTEGILSIGSFSDKENKHISIQVSVLDKAYVDYLKLYIDCYRLK